MHNACGLNLPNKVSYTSRDLERSRSTYSLPLTSYSYLSKQAHGSRDVFGCRVALASGLCDLLALCKVLRRCEVAQQIVVCMDAEGLLGLLGFFD